MYRDYRPLLYSLLILFLILQVNISVSGVTSFDGPDGKFDIDVFDSADEYVKLMK